MLRRICLISHDNQYQSKRVFSKQLKEACERAHIQVDLIEPLNGQIEEEVFERMQSNPPDLTCSFNTILPSPEGVFLWDMLEIPHLFINVDPAIYVLSYTRSPRIAISCVDAFDVSFLEQSGFLHSFFLPHATTQEAKRDVLTPRPKEVIMLGSCYDHEALQESWSVRLDKEAQQIVEQAIHTVTDQQIHFMQALTLAIQKSSLDPAELNFHELCMFVDYYIRGKDRFELLKALQGIPVHVYGEIHEWTNYSSSGWKRFTKQLSHVTLHPPVPFTEALDLMGQCRICLNSSPQFLYGSHERVFHGLAAGAAVVSSYSRYFESEFGQGQGVTLYKPADLGSLKDKVSYLLAHPKECQDQVRLGQQKTLEKHTWDARLPSFLEGVDALLEGTDG